mgnify:CR=1 FL=1
MIKYVQIVGPWRENPKLIPRKITRDAELKKLCAKFLQVEIQNQEVRVCSN